MVKYNKKLIILGVLLVLTITLAVIGLTYAFFNATVQGNASATNTVVQTGTLLLEFTDTQVLTMSNALPGASTSKTFTVKNTGNVRQKYDIDLINITNTFINNELIYTITSNNVDGGEVINAIVPTTETTLLTSYIDPGVTITYTMTVKFKETGSNQNANQGGTFSGKLQIIPRIMGVALGGYIYGDDDNVLQGVTVELHSDPIITTTDETGYYEITDAPVGVHTLYIKQGGTTLGSKEITLASSTESKVENNQELKLPDKIKVHVNIKIDNGLNIHLSQIPTAMEKILTDNTAQSDASINFDSINGNGLYYTSDNQYGEENTKIYYYRGNVNNNWVSFGGFLWRIVRTTSEGGIKLAYSGDGSTTSSGFIGITKFNEDTFELGYTLQFNENQIDSTIKSALDSWYNTNLSTKASYLSEAAIYCADRSSQISIEYGYNYPAANRVITIKRPSYACLSTNASRYTVSSVPGNGYLQKPIALLTADEINYAGVSSTYANRSLNSYIMNNASFYDWWTMSPAQMKMGVSYEFQARASGYLGYNTSTVANVAARPAVSLKSCINITGGNGSQSIPYVLSNSNC